MSTDTLNWYIVEFTMNDDPSTYTYEAGGFDGVFYGLMDYADDPDQVANVTLHRVP